VLGPLRSFGSPALRWSTTKEWDQMKRSKFSEEQVAYALRRITDETREWEVIGPRRTRQQAEGSSTRASRE